MWSKNNVNLIERIPEFYKEIEEIKQIFSVLDDEIMKLREYIIKISDNFFIDTLDEENIKKYEKLLNLNENSGTIELRRQNIMLKISEIPPFSLDMIDRFVARKTGGICSLKSVNGLSIDIKYIANDDKLDEKWFYNDIYTIVPANMLVNAAYDYLRYISALKYKYSNMKNTTWKQFRLGN